MPETPRLALPLLAAGQSQKDVTHNDALLALDRLVALLAVSRSQTVPPATAAIGDVHIVPSAGASAWGQPAGTLMHWQDAGWLPLHPRDGQIVLVADENIVLVHRGGWQEDWPVAGLAVGGRTLLSAPPAVIVPPSGGSTVDAQARSAIGDLILILQQQGLLN
jgi:hypothetical protein